MKKIIFICFIFTLFFTSCTDNELAKKYGGTATIEVPAGYKVTSATFKENDIWYFMEPMEDDYVPTTKIFQEYSNYGIIEGTVKFVEIR